MIITARLLVRSHRKGMSDKDGKSAAITLGIVSPMITQKATMPPKALQGDQLALSLTEHQFLHTMPTGRWRLQSVQRRQSSVPRFCRM